MSEDGSHSPPESEQAEFTRQAARLRALAAEASTHTARDHFADLAEIYDRLAATYGRLADTYSSLGLRESAEQPKPEANVQAQVPPSRG